MQSVMQGQTGGAQKFDYCVDIVLCIDGNKLAPFLADLVVPEAICLINPMRRHIGDIDGMTQITRKETLCLLIILK